MKTPLLFPALLLLALIAAVAVAAPFPSRPYAGIGLLKITRAAIDEGEPLVIYREPGVGRVAEKRPSELPLLSKVVEIPPGEFRVAALGRKGNWFRIGYDDAGRSGWVKMERRWEFTGWDQYLPGRQVRLLPGLRKEFYTFRTDTSASLSPSGSVPAGPPFAVARVQGDWISFDDPARGKGRIRWRDDSGRFLIAIVP